MSLLEILTKYKDAVKHVELGALLHDIDKADEHFKEKPLWHTCKDADSPDQATQMKQDRWKNLLGEFNPPMPDTGINFSQLVVGDKSVSSVIEKGSLSDSFVYHHINGRYKKKDFLITIPLAGAIVHAAICGADGIDSGLDKVGRDDVGEAQKEPFQIATPFGKDSTLWDNSGFFETLQGIVTKSEHLPAIRDFRDLFSKVLGETRIPFNDVTLWDHSFSTASFAKSIFAKILTEYHSGIRVGDNYVLPQRGQYQLRYLKFEVNRDALLAKAHMPEDLHGMDSRIDALMTFVRDFYENEMLIGNETYRDPSRQLFTMPVLCEALNKDFENEIRTTLTARITQKLKELYLEEVAFSILWNAPKEGPIMEANLLNDAAELLKQKSRCRFAPSLLVSLEANAKKGRVCSICHLRNALPYKINDDYLCEVCKKRREDGNATKHELAFNGNKLAFFSFETDLSELRDGRLIQEFYQDKPAKPKSSPGRISRAHNVLFDFFCSFRDSLSFPVIPVTCSPDRLEFIFPADDILGVLSQFQRQFTKDLLGDFKIPVKACVTVFYEKFPLYAILDAATKLRNSLEFGNMDVLLIDSADARFSFHPKGRAHHIFGTAYKRNLEDIENLKRLKSKLATLEKSQVSAIEGALIAKIFEWGQDRIKSDTFQNYAKMILFAPNAFGKKLNPKDSIVLLDAVRDGSLLDVIDIIQHIENKTKG